MLVIFGVAGDLGRRLLFPALRNLAGEGLLPDEFAVVGFARTGLSEDELRERVRESQREAEDDPSPPALMDWLVSRLSYVQSEFTDESGFERLAAQLREVDARWNTGGNYLFYLATAPEFFLDVVQRLGKAGLLEQSGGRWRRVVVEKPFGHDLDSARSPEPSTHRSG